MPYPVIIAKNQTGSPIQTLGLNMPDDVYPAAPGSVVLTAFNRVWEIQHDPQLRALVTSATVLLNDGTDDLNVAESLQLISPFASKLPPGDVPGDSIEEDDLAPPLRAVQNSFLRQPVYVSITEALSISVGVNPISLADALFTGKVAGGSVAGTGTNGIVSGSFASAVAETGTGVGQAGLGSAPATNQPYNSTDFPGQYRIPVELQKRDGDAIVLADLLTTAILVDRDAAVYGYLSYRSDLGPDLKWRLWLYYRRASDGFETPFTPDLALSNVTLMATEVFFRSALPLRSMLGSPLVGAQGAPAIGPKSVGTNELDDGAVTDLKVATANKDGTATTPSMRTLGTGAQQAVAGNDARLSDARPPSGAASGDLAGNYPGPLVKRASEDFAFSGSVTPAPLGTSQNDYNPTGLATATEIRQASLAAVNITGLQGGVAGRVLVLVNVGSFNITLKNQDAASAAANRFAATGAVLVEPDGVVALRYDATSQRWRVVATSGQIRSGQASGYSQTQLFSRFMESPGEHMQGWLSDYNNTATTGAGLIQYMRVWLVEGEIYDRARCFVSGGTGAGRNVIMGIYDNAVGGVTTPLSDSGVPFNRLAQTAATLAVAGYNTISLTSPFTVPATGFYWIAHQSSSALLEFVTSRHSYPANFLKRREQTASGVLLGTLPATTTSGPDLTALSNPQSAIAYSSILEQGS